MTVCKSIRAMMLALLSMFMYSCSTGVMHAGSTDLQRFEQDSPEVLQAHDPEQTEVGVWLSIQSSSEKASANPQQATDVEKELANQRFLDTYKHPIPDYFPSNLGISNSQ